MHQSPTRIVGLSVIVGLLLASGQALANYYDLFRRVPDSANTIILIDVERMLVSPIALKEHWRDKGISEGVALTSLSTQSATCSRRGSTSSGTLKTRATSS